MHARALSRNAEKGPSCRIHYQGSILFCEIYMTKMDYWKSFCNHEKGKIGKFQKYFGLKILASKLKPMGGGTFYFRKHIDGDRDFTTQ